MPRAILSSLGNLHQTLIIFSFKCQSLPFPRDLFLSPIYFISNYTETPYSPPPLYYNPHHTVQCNCQNVTAQAPASSDCASLIESTEAIAQAAGPTFVVQPDNFELITFGTCALEWTNFGCEPLEYCWDELGSTGGVVNQLCFEQGGGTAAACNADDDLWLLQYVPLSSRSSPVVIDTTLATVGAGRSTLMQR